MNCYLCNSNETTESQVGSTPYFSCRNCGLDFIPVFGNEKDYLLNYRQHHSAVDDATNNQRRYGQYQVDLQKIFRYQLEGELLDIGCSNGLFSNLIQSNSEFRVTGIDLDKAAVKAATDNFPSCQFVESDLENFRSSKAFDAIVFRGVFQYLDANLQPSFQKAIDLLKPGGYIYIFSAPHADAFTFKLMGEKWHFFAPIEHKLFMRKKSFDFIAQKYNLVSMDTSYPYIETSYCDLDKNYADLIRLCKAPESYDGPTPAFYGNIIETVFRKPI